MIQAPFLKAGDTIGILSTARKTTREAMDKAGRIIEAQGFKVQFAPHLFADHHQFAGTDTQRIEDMHSLLKESKVKAIFCARGGYGTTRIVDQIDWSLLEKQPKWICGFSDVTAIHCHLHNLGLESIHSIMAAQFDTEDPDRKKVLTASLPY